MRTATASSPTKSTTARSVKPELAESLHIPNLVLWHTEDTRLPERKTLYTAEGRQYFSGNLFVPDDLESIAL